MTTFAAPMTFELYGELGEKYGKTFTMLVSSVSEGISLLAANFKDFKQHIIDSDTRLSGYEVWAGDTNLEAKQEDFHMQREGSTVKIIPVIKGAGATGRIIAGVVLIIIGAVLTITGYGAAAAPYFYSAGIGLLIGGIAEKLSPKPKGMTVQDDGAVDSANSYLFSGAVNSTQQGRPVAVGYGKMIVGSNVISASITTSDIPV